VPDQIAFTGAGRGKGSDAAKLRNQRHRRSPWRRVEISLAALEIGSLTRRLPALPLSGPCVIHRRDKVVTGFPVMDVTRARVTSIMR
jgi:hypothetical protein